MLSHLAAKALGDLTERQEAILYTFGMAQRPLTDPELQTAYITVYEDERLGANPLPLQAESGVRTRRNELGVAGLLEPCGEVLQHSASGGRRFTQWKLTESGWDAYRRLYR